MSANSAMKHPSPAILLLTCGGMEVTWRLAWASLIMMSLTQRIFPAPDAIMAFSVAALLTFFARDRGWRWISIIGLHIVGCLLATLNILYVFSYRSYPLWSRTWLDALFSMPGAPLEWVILCLTLFWAMLFWGSGIQFAHRSNAYQDVCGRFDLGMGMLGGLLFIKLVLLRDGVQILDPMTKWLVLPFLLFGTVAMGSARNRQSAGRKTYRSGFQIIGVVLSFAVVVTLCGAALLLLFWPYFTQTAATGYDLLKRGVQPFAALLTALLRFLLMPRGGNLSDSTTAPGHNGIQEIPPGETRWWVILLEKILGLGAAGFFGLIFLAMLGVGIWHFIQWLLAKTPRGERQPRPSGRLWAWLLQFPLFLRLWWEWFFHRLRGYSTAIQFYRVLSDWGRHSGLPHRPTETPGEYGARLSRYFPAIHQEIALIVALFQQEVYAESVLDTQQVSLAAQALHQLRRPALWPSRLRTWFREDAGQGLGMPS